MSEKIFSTDPLEGTVTTWKGDGKGGFVLTQHCEDKTWERDACVQMSNENEEWEEGMKKGYIHYAHIPLHILYQWMLEGIDPNNPAELFAKVNSREYCMLKTVPKNHAPKVQ